MVNFVLIYFGVNQIEYFMESYKIIIRTMT